ncbi:Vacuolar protein sorting-associated protein 75 [Candida tropicalis]
MAEDEGKKLQASLDKLADWEKNMNDVEKEVEIHRMKKTQPMYEKRRSILKTIPKFWYIVLAENDDFADYISPEDLKFLEYIDDIYVHYPIVDGEADNFRDFDITISFGKSKLIPQQEITKKFRTIVKEDGEESITSEPVDIQWPKELSKINPITIKEKYQGKDKKEMSAKDKMNYRLGMKSFFSWFRWTGKKPGKEFRNGDEVANLLVDLFLNGVKFYILGLNESEGDDEELDSSEGEELDISDDDDDDNEEPAAKRAKTE